jgi:hypothetical protein
MGLWATVSVAVGCFNVAAVLRLSLGGVFGLDGCVRRECEGRKVVVSQLDC